LNPNRKVMPCFAKFVAALASSSYCRAAYYRIPVAGAKWPLETVGCVGVCGAVSSAAVAPNVATKDFGIVRAWQPAELCADCVDGWVGQVSSRRVHRLAGVGDYRYGSGALYLAVCDDPMHREQIESGPPGARGLLHTY